MKARGATPGRGGKPSRAPERRGPGAAGDDAAPARRPEGASVRALERRVRELTAALDATRERYERQLAAARRAADRQLAGMVSEIVALRHHQARAEMLARLLAERDRDTATAPGPSQEINVDGQAPRALGG